MMSGREKLVGLFRLPIMPFLLIASILSLSFRREILLLHNNSKKLQYFLSLSFIKQIQMLDKAFKRVVECFAPCGFFFLFRFCGLGCFRAHRHCGGVLSQCHIPYSHLKPGGQGSRTPLSSCGTYACVSCTHSPGRSRESGNDAVRYPERTHYLSLPFGSENRIR